MRYFLVLFLIFHGVINAAPEEERMGVSLGYPPCESIATRVECKVGSFSNPKGNVVTKSDNVLVLKVLERKVELNVNASHLNELLNSHLQTHKTTGLLVLKNNEIVFEGYQYGRNHEMPMRSFSMSKTIVAMLVGIAHEKGLIRSLDDKVSTYFVSLAGSAYGDTTIKNLLRMSSGVKFNEDYAVSKKSDLVIFYTRLGDLRRGKARVTEAFRSFNERINPQGEIFKYASIETTLLCHLLSAATQRSVSELTREWLWQPMGAASNAYWLIYPEGGEENCAGGFFATVRDWGRLGMLLANNGKIGDTQVVSSDYIRMATDYSLHEEAFKPGRATNYFGYGFQTWVFPLKSRSFAMLGIYGQSIFIQSDSGVVMVETSVNDLPMDVESMRKKIMIWFAILAALGGQTEKLDLKNNFNSVRKSH